MFSGRYPDLTVFLRTILPRPKVLQSYRLLIKILSEENITTRPTCSVIIIDISVSHRMIYLTFCIGTMAILVILLAPVIFSANCCHIGLQNFNFLCPVFFLVSKSDVIAPTTPQMKPATGIIQKGIVIVILH